MIAFCEEFISSYNPRVSLDDHVERSAHVTVSSAHPPPHSPPCPFLTITLAPGVQATWKPFAVEVCLGVLENKSIIKPIISKFYVEHSDGEVMRADYLKFTVFAFILLFRLEQVGYEALQSMLNADEMGKLEMLAAHIINMQDMHASGTLDAWARNYDLEYITGLIANLRRQMEKVPGGERAAEPGRRTKAPPRGGAGGSKTGAAPAAATSHTSHRRPNITAPKPRLVPTPLQIKRHSGHGDTSGGRPMYTRTSPSLPAPANLATTQPQPFSFHKSRDRVSRQAAKVEAEQAAELAFSTPYISSRTTPGRNAGVSMNASSILRMDALNTRKSKIEAEQVREFEANLRDGSEYFQWQTQMLEQDKKTTKEQIERTRALAKASSVSARLAMTRRWNENKELAHAMSRESEQMVKQCRLEKDMRYLANHHLVSEISRVRDEAPRNAERKIYQHRQKMHDEIKRKSKESSIIAAAEHEQELARKVLRVKKLQAAHHVHKPQVAVFDPTTTAGTSLLDEMSLVEMKERLEINKTRDKEEVDRRRVQHHKSALVGRADKTERVLRVAAAQASAEALQAVRRREAHAEVVERAADLEVQEAAMNDTLMQRLEVRRRGRLDESNQMAAADQARGGHSAQLARRKEAVEQTRYAQQLKGSERSSVRRQATSQVDAHTNAVTGQHDRANALSITTRENAERDERYNSESARVIQAKRDVDAQAKREVSEKKSNFRSQRAAEKQLFATREYADPYAYAVQGRNEAEGA